MLTSQIKYFSSSNVEIGRGFPPLVKISTAFVKISHGLLFTVRLWDILMASNFFPLKGLEVWV